MSNLTVYHHLQKLFLLVMMFFGSTIINLLFSNPVVAAINPDLLSKEIDDFMSAGADGYLVWQYSGYAPQTGKQYFENDPYSFFREGSENDTKVCEVLRAKGAQYNNKSIGIGVNTWSLGNYDQAEILDHLNYLKNNCGVKTMRVFAKAGGVTGIQKVAAAANQAGVQLVVAIGDYSNGGGGIPKGAPKTWYESGYKTQTVDGVIYRNFAQNLSNISGITGFELANEPHCSGDDTAVPAYTAWGADIGGLLQGKSLFVGYGQMASQDTTKCDSTAPMSPSHFSQTNAVDSINITSAHYYNLSEKASALRALAQSKSLSKPFYIGEAPAGDMSGSSAYDLSIYDDYNADNNEFYIHPILGLDPTQPRDVTVIRNDLINQGYEAHCATPGFKIGLTQSGERWMKAWVQDKIPDPKNDYGAVIGGGQNPRLVSPRVPPAEAGTWPIRSTLTVDYRDVLVPNFRDTSGKQYLMTSLEEYFGFKDTKINDRTLALLNSAPVNNLLSNRERCIQSLHMLTKQEEMCNKLLEANRDNCALYPRPIPSTDYTIRSLLDEYKSRFNIPNNFYTDTSGKNLFCIDLISDTNLDESTKKFKTAILNTPLTMDRAYRPAFLVTSIELSIPSYKRMYNLFTHPLAGTIGAPDKPQDAILVNAFKVPDITTNKGTDVANTAQGNTIWNDSAILTRNLVLTKSQQNEYTKKSIDRKNALAATSLKYDTAQSKEDEIFCLAGGKTGIGGGECNDPLSKALVDIINTESLLAKNNSSVSAGFTPECPDLKKESATQIVDTGSFGTRDIPSKIYTVRFGAELLNNLFLIAGEGEDDTPLDTTHQITPKGKSDPQFAETWKETSEGSAVGRDPRIPPISGNNTEVRDWGLKTMFHVVDDPDAGSGTSPYKANFYPGGTTCCDETKVKHFLVYPEGYDLNTVETTLMGSFFTTEQLVSLKKDAEEYDRFQVSGDILKFVPGFVKRKFSDPSADPPNWNGNPAPVGMDGGGVIEVSSCTPVYSRVEDPPGSGIYINDVQIGWRLPCTRSFEFNIVQKGQALSAGILGGRLGHYLQIIQKTLHTKVSDARQYIDACKTTEQFLRGQCGQSVTPVATNPPEECTTISCLPPPATSGAPAPPAPSSGICVEIRVRNGQVYLYNRCACSLAEGQIQNEAGALWCGPLGRGDTLFPGEEKGPFCYQQTPPNPVCFAVDAPGNSPGPPACISTPERVCVSW